MISDGNVYVLDAKYYKYGATRRSWNLPESTSINKQITYGEYIAEEAKFKKIHGEHFKTYNAFLLPFNKSDWDISANMHTLGKAVSSWKKGDREYEQIIGVLIDVKHLMEICMNRKDKDEIKMLTCLINNEFI